jgi:hypothetical protein
MREGFLSGEFFPEPSEIIIKTNRRTSSIDAVRYGRGEYFQLSRQRLNKWLSFWDYSDISDIHSRLLSSKDSEHESAVWEIFLNALFREMGYQVVREPLAIQDEVGNKKPSPDFLISKDGLSFLVEAKTISDEALTTEAKIWNDIVKEIDDLKSNYFFVGLVSRTTSRQHPSTKYLKNQIDDWVSSLNWKDLISKDSLNLPIANFSSNGWNLEVSAYPKREVGESDDFVGSSMNVGTGVITDLDDLKKAIKDKRNRYGRVLPHPLIIAILENSFALKVDNHHRIGALFGNQALQISLESHEAKSIRFKNGLWSKARDTDHVVGFLLLGRLQTFLPHVELPEFWVNPYTQSQEFVNSFPLTVWALRDSEYAPVPGLQSWDGFTQILESY